MFATSLLNRFFCNTNQYFKFHINYRPQRSCGQDYVFTRVCDSVHRGGLQAGRTPLGQGDPPRPRENPPDQGDPPDQGEPPRPGRPPRTRETTPPPGSRLQNTVYERPVRILLECILVVSSNFKGCLNLFWQMLWFARDERAVSPL